MGQDSFFIWSTNLYIDYKSIISRHRFSYFSHFYVAVCSCSHGNHTTHGISHCNPDEANEDSSGGIIVQTLMNMRTINAFNLERHVFEDYLELHDKEQGDTFWRSVKSGSASGYSMLIQQWVNALYFYWGGWLIHEYPKHYTFTDFVIAQFALLFALFALGGSSVGAIDKKEADDSAKRIFHLVNHKCDIDPLSGSGKKLD